MWPEQFWSTWPVKLLAMYRIDGNQDEPGGDCGVNLGYCEKQNRVSILTCVKNFTQNILQLLRILPVLLLRLLWNQSLWLLHQLPEKTPILETAFRAVRMMPFVGKWATLVRHSPTPPKQTGHVQLYQLHPSNANKHRWPAHTDPTVGVCWRLLGFV